MINKELLKQSKKLIEECDTVLIGAGAGLSTAAGLSYSGKRFTDNFADYIEEYGLTDMYSAAFYPYPTLEHKWGYFSRHIKFNLYDAPVGKLYLDLLKLIENKEYFVLTTNGDAQFFKAGFEESRIFATQGHYGYFQCEKACHDTLYDNKSTIFQMVEQQENFMIPSKLLPICPICGGNLVAHLRIDNNFVENDDWKAASKRYVNFLRQAEDKNLVLLELGVGFNTPVIIRWPFEQIAAGYRNSTLIRVNMDNVQAHYPIPRESVFIKGDIGEFLSM